MEFDAFICHTSADKETVVNPLHDLLEASGIHCWLDKNEIRWGDSLTARVNEGLRRSRYVIVVLSTNFVVKQWPQRELNAALNQEAASGESRVLPLLVGTSDERASLIERYPLLNDKLHMVWPDDSERLVDDIRSLLGQSAPAIDNTTRASRRRIPDPIIRRKPTELECHRFVQRGFKEIREYFVDGVAQLSEHEHVDAELNDIHAAKFVCYVFASGARKAQCKIWIGGLSNGNQISYSSSFHHIDDDNSFSDWITVSRSELSWEAGGFGGFTSTQSGHLMTSEQAAEYLWKQFIQPLGN